MKQKKARKHLENDTKEEINENKHYHKIQEEVGNKWQKSLLDKST